MTKRLFVLSVACVLLLACDSTKLYEKHCPVFDNYDWQKDNVVSLSNNFETAPGVCDVYVAVRHVFGFPFVKFAMQLKITQPNGDEIAEVVSVEVINKDKKYNADCSGDYCDLQQLALRGINFKEAGEYTFELQHMSPIDPLQMVMDVGVVVRKKGE